jgi:hypothetical protein
VLRVDLLSKLNDPIRFCFVAKRLCVFCSEPLPWDKRADALNAHHVAASAHTVL